MVKLTQKELDAITALQALTKTWPKSLKIGGDTDSKFMCIWKRANSCTHEAVANVKIENMDY